jgi:hypothetical protein
MDRRVLPDLRSGLEIVASKLGSDIRLKGACSLALRRSLEDPVLLRRLCSLPETKAGRKRRRLVP